MSYDEEPDRDYDDATPAGRRGRDRDRIGIGQRFDRVDKHIAELSSNLDTLGERLGMILGAEHPTPALAGAVRDNSSEDSQLSQWLDGTAMRLHALGQQVRYLTERVDL